MPEGFERGRLDEIDHHRRDEENAGQNLREGFERAIAAPKNDGHRDYPQHETVDGHRQLDSERRREKVVKHGRSGDQAAGLADRALDYGRDQHVPKRPFTPGRRIGFDQALTGGVRKAEGGFKTVVFRNVGDGDAPQQRVAETASGGGRGDEVAGADPGHHQDHAGTEMAQQAGEVGLGELEVVT